MVRVHRGDDPWPRARAAGPRRAAPRVGSDPEGIPALAHCPRGTLPRRFPRPGASALLEARALPPASFPTSDLRPLTSDPKHPVIWTHRFGPAGARVFASTSEMPAPPSPIPFRSMVSPAACFGASASRRRGVSDRSSGGSLKGLALPAPSAPLLRPGRNVTWQGTATGFQWGQAKAGEGPDSSTTAIHSRPGCLRARARLVGVRWMPETPVSLAAVWWELPIPAEAVLEGTRDGRTWIPLAPLTPPAQTERPVFARFESRTLTGLRLSVPRTAPGQGFALREVAVYASEDELPSAILAATPDPPGLVRLRTAGDGALAGIRLAPGWRGGIVRLHRLQGTPGQMLPTASGALFLSVFPGGDAPGRVHRIERKPSPRRPGTPGRAVFVRPCPDTRIAWDGEWLYTLSGFRLDRVRKALGTGPAGRTASPRRAASLPTEGAPTGFAWTDFRLGEDGWLHGRYTNDAPGSLLRPDGQRSASSGRAGSAFAGMDRAPWPPREWRRTPFSRGLPDRRGSPRRSATARGSGSSPGGRWAETRVSEVRFRRRSRPDRSRRGADRPVVRATSDPLRWGGKPGDRLGIHPSAGCVDPRTQGPPRRGAAPSLAGPLVAALAALLRKGPGPNLIELATAPDAPPAVRAAAFRALGDLEGDLDPEVFRDLGSVTDPSVTAAIFEGMRRRGATLPGAARVALRLAPPTRTPDWPGPRFPSFATGGRGRRFRRPRCTECREDWPRAFDLLAEFRSRPWSTGSSDGCPRPPIRSCVGDGSEPSAASGSCRTGTVGPKPERSRPGSSRPSATTGSIGWISLTRFRTIHSSSGIKICFLRSPARFGA